MNLEITTVVVFLLDLGQIQLQKCGSGKSKGHSSLKT